MKMAYESSPYENSHRRAGGRYDEYPGTRPRTKEMQANDYDDYQKHSARPLYNDESRSRKSRDFTDYAEGRGGRDAYSSRDGGMGNAPYDARRSSRYENAPQERYRDNYSGRRGYDRAGGVRRGGRSGGPDQPQPPPSRVLGVFGLSGRTEERDLYDIMSEFGQVEDIQMVYDSLTGRSRGFAFVYFANVDQAREARTACARGLELHGRIVRIDYSRTEAPHQPTPGIYMGKDKRRMNNYGERRYPYGGGDRRYPRSPRVFRRSRSRTPLSPPRGRPLPEAGLVRRRARTQSSSRSRSPPPVYSPKRRVVRPGVETDVHPDGEVCPSRSLGIMDRDGHGRYVGSLPKDDQVWSDTSASVE